MKRPERKDDRRLIHLMEYCENVKIEMDLMENLIREMQRENEESKRNGDKDILDRVV